MSTRARTPALAGWSSMLGTSIEWFDFFLYGTAAALVFNRVFFPRLDPLTGTLASFATYGVGFVGRPLGGVVFGHIGDRVGRKSTLLLTLVLMGAPTVLIGLLPSYASIGYWAAVLLVLLRLVQGIAVGGEWGGAVLMAVEHAPAGRRGFFGSLPQMGVGPGLILASVAMGLVSRLPEPALLAWGWRLPFLFSVVLLAVGWFIRRRVPESPEFLAMRDAGGGAAESPTVTVLRDHWRTLLTIVGARVAENTWFYIVSTFALSYATSVLGMGRGQVLNAVTAGAAVSIVTMPCFGMLGDRIGARRLFAAAMAAMCVFAWGFFALLARRGVFVDLAMVLAIGVVFAALYAPEAALFAAQFPAAIRYSGISISVQAAGALGGGLAPLVATALVRRAGGSAVPVMVYLVGLGVVALVCTAFMRAPAREG